MRKQKKNFLGAVGLSVVAATTIYAASLPAPYASAIANSITDTLQVRVVSPEANVVMSPLQNVVLEAPGYSFNVAYENVSDVIVKITRIGAYHTATSTHTVWTENVDFQNGVKDLNINLDDYGGYDHYILTSEGIDVFGMHVSQQSVELTYSKPTTTNPDGSVDIDVLPSPEAPVDSAIIKVIDSNGNVVVEIPVDNPGDAENINLNDYDLPDGSYTIETEFYDENGNQIPDSTTTTTVVKDDDETTSPVDLGTETEEAASVVIIVKDPETGEVKKTIEIENPSPNENINLDGLDAGNYNVEIEYKNEQGETIGTSSTTVVKKEDPSTTPVTIVPQEEPVAKVVIEVKDSEGNVVKTVEIENPGETVPISTDDLPAGDYTIDVTYYNGEGQKIGDSTNDVAKDSPVTGSVEVEDKGDNVDKVIITVTDPTTGEVKKVIEIEDPSTGDVKVDLDGLDAGDYDVKIDYYDGDTKIGESETTTTKPTDTSTTPIEVPTGVNIDKAVVVVKDQDGNTVKTIEVENPGENINISTSDLPAGNYTFETIFYDIDGDTVGTSEKNVTKANSSGAIDVDVPSILNEIADTVINIYDKDGNLVRYSIITDNGDGTMTIRTYDKDGRLLRTEVKERTGNSMSLPLDGLKTGNYGVETVYRDAKGNVIGEVRTTVVFYEAPAVAPSGSPDTGGLFRNLDISRVDYLATGLLVFFIFGIVGLGIVMRKRNSTKVSKKRR